MHLLLPGLNKPPKTPLLREVGNNVPILIQNDSFKGKSAIIWGVEATIWEASEKYGVDYDLIKNVINCECQLDRKHETCIGDSGRAFGRCQFHKPTFLANCEGDYKSETDQIYCMAKMFSENKQGNWTCYPKVLGDLK